MRAGRAFLAAELSRPGWLDFGAFRWADMATGQAVRAALGVITPLAIGIGTGHVEFGSYAALGALPAGVVSFRGVNRTRVLAVAVAAAGMAVSTFVGAATEAAAGWLLVPVVFAWAYAAGLLASLGPTALSVSLQWPIALLIASAIPLPPEQAAVRASLVLAGGLWQGLLVISTWAMNRGGAERAATADSFRALAGYATDLAAGLAGPPDPEGLPGARALADPNPLIQTDEHQLLLDLEEEAERLRATLAALTIGRPDRDQTAAGRRLLERSAQVLSELAASLTGRRRQRTAHLAAASAVLADADAESGELARWAGEALLGQLRAACAAAARVTGVDPPAASGGPAKRGGESGSRDHGPLPSSRVQTRREAALTLRASLGTSSEAGRHALRLAVVAAAAEAIVRASGLGHGYWAVLTVFIVLRPDYSSTLYRGLQRAAGTVAGAGLGVCTVLLAKVGNDVLLAGIGVSLLAAYAVFTVSYLLFAVFLTDFVVVLLALLGLPPLPTAIARLAGTGIGTGLALIAYVLWPTWAGRSVSENFARLIEAQGRYAAALLRSCTRPREMQPARLGDLRLAARRARIDAEASAHRLADEPDHPPVSSGLALALVTAAHRIAQADLALAAAVAARAPADDAELRPGLDQLAALIERATVQLAGWLRGWAAPEARRSATAVPPLRAAWQAVWPVALPPDSEQAGLAASTDALVDAINAAAHVLAEGRFAASPASGSAPPRS